MSITFNGSNYLSTVSSITAPPQATVCFWMKLTGITDHHFFGTGAKFEIRLKADLVLNELHKNGNGLACTTSIVVGTLYHVACSSDNVSHNNAVYINGVSEATGSTANATGVSTTCMVGTSNGRPAGTLGDLEDVRMYDRILTANEIETIYNARGSDKIVSGLLNRWRLTDLAEGVTVASNVIDLSDTKNNLVQTGSPVYAAQFITRDRSIW